MINWLKIHSYETFATQDWPWIRLVIFLQGCQFRCLYCQNPDTLPIELGETGKEMTAEEILELAMKEKEYFWDTGWVTFSGGEPLLQAKQLKEVLKLLQENGFHTCIDTNGWIWNEDVKECLKYTNHVLPDIKQINQNRHKNLTWNDNQNSLSFVQYLDEEKKNYRVRYVVVPWYTDNEEDIRGLGEFLKELKNLQRIELLPYHNLWVSKWEKLGIAYPLEGVHASDIKELDKVKNILEEYVAGKVFIRG